MIVRCSTSRSTHGGREPANKLRVVPAEEISLDFDWNQSAIKNAV